MKLLPQSLLDLIPRRGLLRWRDLHRLTAALRQKSAIFAPGSAREVPGGIEINLDDVSLETELRPLEPYAVYSTSMRVAVHPGLVFGGAAWIEPRIGWSSLFATTAPTLPPADEIWLKVTAQPVLKNYTYNGSAEHRAPMGTILVSAEIITRASAGAAFEDVTARGLVTAGSVILVRDAVSFVRLGYRADDRYVADAIWQRIYSFAAATTGTSSDPEWTLDSNPLPWPV